MKIKELKSLSSEELIQKEKQFKEQLFEIGGIPEDFAKQVLRLVAFQLPVRTTFVTRVGH